MICALLRRLSEEAGGSAGAGASGAPAGSGAGASAPASGSSGATPSGATGGSSGSSGPPAHSTVDGTPTSVQTVMDAVKSDGHDVHVTKSHRTGHCPYFIGTCVHCNRRRCCRADGKVGRDELNCPCPARMKEESERKSDRPSDMPSNAKLEQPYRIKDGDKKFRVWVRKEDTGNIVKVDFGDASMEIRRDNDDRRKSFRARHNCDKNPGPKHKRRYWSCKFWEKATSVSELLDHDDSKIRPLLARLESVL